MPPFIQLDGASLTLETVERVARGDPESGGGNATIRVGLAAAARPQIERARQAVEAAAAHQQPVYGVNTGLGRLSDIRIPADHILDLQLNLLRSHALGVGEPLAQPIVRALLLLRANSLAKGFSGVRPLLIERLCDLLNCGVHPLIPSQGSVGASGDLAPLAHMALVLVGEGEAWYRGRRLPGREALAAAGLEPLRLQAKEGLSLLNGTQAMLALACLAQSDAERLMEAADLIAALSLDALRGTPAAFDPRIQAARGFAGQAVSAARLRRALQGSEIRESHRACARLQDAYSLRCIPQVHGAVRDTLAFTRQAWNTEINAAVDNPLVFFSAAGEMELISGGNFHGQPLALALDYLAIAFTALAGISERRIERLVNPSLNEGLPAFLARNPGLESGLMMAQVTAAALVADCRGRAHPASVESIATSGDKEDFVSMGMNAGLKLQMTLENVARVLALEAVCAVQALDFLAPLRSGAAAERLRAWIRERVPPFAGDRSFSSELESLARDLRSLRLPGAESGRL